MEESHVSNTSVGSKIHSIIIRYDGDLDMLIRDYLAPLAREIEILNESWFLRYWETGPCVRWRVHSCGEPDQRIRDFVGRAQELIKSVPSDKTWTEEQYESIARVLADREKVQSYRSFVPSGTIWVDSYVPETMKYGTGQLLDAAHEHFIASSSLALDFLDLRLERKQVVALVALMLATEFELTRQPLTDHRWIPPLARVDGEEWRRGLDIQKLQAYWRTKTGFSHTVSGFFSRWSQVVVGYREDTEHCADLQSVPEPLDIFRHLFMNRVGLDLYSEWVARKVAEEIAC